MPLWILSTLMGLRKAAGALLGFVARYPWQAASIALLCASVWLWHGWNGAEAKLDQCRDGRKADRAAYIAAQDEAAAKARAARIAAEKRYKELADEADKQEAKARRDAMDAAERYIAAHRVRPETAAAGSSRSGPGTASEDHSAQGGNGPGQAAELDEGSVVVTADDVRVCTENTSRLLSVRQWALGLSR